MAEKQTAERAKELLVYGPLGLALFVRDAAPQFLRMFVARGRNEVQQRRRDVGEQLDQMRAMGESAAADGGPEMLRIVTTGIAALRERAEEALSVLSAAVQDAMPDAEPERAAAAAPAGEPPPVQYHDPSGAGSRLAIPEYDDLSASQVVDRLDGLALTELEAIRSYEATHRARNTILGKIDQILRTS